MTEQATSDDKQYCDGNGYCLKRLSTPSPAPKADNAALVWPSDAQFQLEACVQKKGRASWRGHVVGWYRTSVTALGYAVESAFEPGSVQIYPESALEPWEPRP